MSDEQRSEPRGPRRVFPNPLGWEPGCIARRMQRDFHHGLGPPRFNTCLYTIVVLTSRDQAAPAQSECLTRSEQMCPKGMPEGGTPDALGEASRPRGLRHPSLDDRLSR